MIAQQDVIGSGVGTHCASPDTKAYEGCRCGPHNLITAASNCDASKSVTALSLQTAATQYNRKCQTRINVAHEEQSVSRVIRYGGSSRYDVPHVFVFKCKWETGFVF